MWIDQIFTTVIWELPGARLKSIFVLWDARAHQRRQLRRLDDDLLRDIGIDRTAAHQELAKPFWKA